MSTDQPPAITYWYHPESECYWIHNPATDKPLDPDLGDGMSVEIENEYEWVKRHIEQIDANPAHKLPDGVTAVIKLGQILSGKHLSGMIWYDTNKRFTDGYPINVSNITREPGGIIVTPSGNKYLVEVIIDG